MNYSDNYSLRLPDRGAGDRANVDDINYNSEKIDGLTHGNRTMLGPGWDAETDWMKGDFVVKTDNSTLEADYYECKEDHTTGAWDASKWEHRTVAEVLEALAQGAGGATSLDELDDVEITSPSEGQILRRNANGDWVNTDMPDASVTKTAEDNPVEFTDGADAPLVKCVTAIQGNQDLHGYDKPWVGGAGKNKADISANTVSSSQTWNCTPTYSNNGVIATATGTYARIGYVIPVVSGQTITISLYALKSANTYGRIVFNSTEDWNNPEYGYNDTLESRTKHTITATTTSNILFIGLYCTTTQSSGTLTIDSVMVEYSNQATDFAPYSNICPITAYTEGEIEVRGKNIFGTSVSSGYTITSLGVIESDPTRSATLEYTPIQGNIDYVLSYVGNMNNGVFFYDQNKDFISFLAWGSTPRTFKSPSNAAYLRFSFNSATVPVNMMVEKGSVASTYEPYTSTTHTTTFTNSIYQGNADFVGGTETHDWEKIVFDGSSSTGWERWTNYGSVTRFDFDAASLNINKSGYIFSNYLPKVTIGTENAIGINTHGTTPKIQIQITTSLLATDDVAGLMGYFTSNNLEVAFALNTPTAETITPTNLPIKSLFGYNHIESSTGDMEVEYIAKAFSPITEIVDSQISALQKMMELMLTSAREATMTASANYTTGTLIVACGALYKATTAISSGASLVVGTNITPTTIAAELVALA